MPFLNLEKDTTTRLNVFRIKDMEKISSDMVKVNCYNEDKEYTIVMLPKYIGKQLTKEMAHNINKTGGYFLIISIDHSTSNFIHITNDLVVDYPISFHNIVKFCITIDGKRIEGYFKLPFTRNFKKVTRL